MPPFFCFKGRCYLFFVCSGGPWLLVFFLVVCWALEFWFRITSFQKVAAFPAKLWSVRVVVSNLCCFIRWFLYRDDAPFLCFLGRCCLIFVFSGGLWLLLLFLVVFFGFSLLVINSYLSKKKKKWRLHIRGLSKSDHVFLPSKAQMRSKKEVFTCIQCVMTFLIQFFSN